MVTPAASITRSTSGVISWLIPPPTMSAIVVFHNASSRASVSSAVEAEPPRSPVSTEPSERSRSTPARSRLAAACSPTWRSMSSADRMRASRIGNAPAGDIGGGAVHGLEEGVLLADVGARHHAEPADQAGAHVAHDVTVEVSEHDGVELVRVEGQLHDEVVEADILDLGERVVLGHRPGRLRGTGPRTAA